MRLLIRCANCLRQYDASGRTAGDRLRCLCGQALTVEQPAGHDAAVVRCSSCGAPRTGEEPVCAHCGAEFTLWERDLHTVCPACCARVSDEAAFCHHCGTALSAVDVAGAASDFQCPACVKGQKLVSRRMDDVNLLECERCGGLWLGEREFNRLREKAVDRGKNADPGALPQRAREPDRDPDPGRRRYRPCPICKDLMVPQNFGHISGVIIDRCREHGLWLDDDELPRILQWIRDGGLKNARAAAAAERHDADHRRAVLRVIDTRIAAQHQDGSPGIIGFLREAWEWL